jgi:uncharacterized protein (TIGR02246 family)
MKSVLYVMLFTGFFLETFIPAFSQNPDKKESKEIAAVKQLAIDLDEAWNRHDAIALSELFLEDADFQWHTGDLLKSRKQIEQYFSMSVFKDLPMDRRHNSTIQRIRFLRPDIAIGDGTLVVSREGAPENEKPALSVLFTSVAQKKQGHWHIAAVRLMLTKGQ